MRIVVTRDGAERVGLGTGNIDRAFARELDVIEIEHLVVETLQCALGQRDQTHRQLEARQPRGRLDEMAQVLEVDRNILALANSAHGRNQPNGSIGPKHDRYAWRALTFLFFLDSASLRLRSGCAAALRAPFWSLHEDGGLYICRINLRQSARLPGSRDRDTPNPRACRSDNCRRPPCRNCRDPRG